MDPRLKKTLKKAEKLKQEIYEEREAKELLEMKKKAASVKKEMPEARKWVEEKLFNIIMHADAKDQDTVSLYDPESKISDEALAKAAGEVDGITVIANWVAAYNDPDGAYSREAHWQYSVRWSSLYDK